MSRAVVRAALLHMLPSYLAFVDVEAEPLLRQAGMVCDDLATGRVVRRSQIHEALSLAAGAAGSAEIGLALGRMARPERLGPTGMAMKAGASVEACLRMHVATMPAMQSHVELGLRTTPTEAIVAHRLVGDNELSWHLYEGAAAFHVQMLRHLLGPLWAPDRVTFPHRLKGDRLEYEEFFQAPVQFGRHAESRIYFRREALARIPVGQAGSLGPAVPRAAMPDRPSEAELAKSDVRIAILRMVDATLADGPITLEHASRVLGLSPRSVQRRLDDDGSTFQDIVDRRRHRLALQCLADPHVSVTSVAMRLGYSDAAHFTRAFRRWQLCSPIHYRKHLSEASGQLPAAAMEEGI